MRLRVNGGIRPDEVEPGVWYHSTEGGRPPTALEISAMVAFGYAPQAALLPMLANRYDFSSATFPCHDHQEAAV